MSAVVLLYIVAAIAHAMSWHRMGEDKRTAIVAGVLWFPIIVGTAILGKKL